MQEIKYEIGIKRLEDISPQFILSILYDIRKNIEELDSSFVNIDLVRMLAIIESGKYEINGTVSTRINLSSAKRVVDTYRKYFEGGCQSCVNFGKETIDTQDAKSGWYCKISDSDYNKDEIGNRPRVYYAGLSPKVRKHYKNPCDDWKPLFSSTIDKLIEQEQT